MKTVHIILETKVSNKLAKELIKDGVHLDTDSPIYTIGKYKFITKEMFIKGE